MATLRSGRKIDANANIKYTTEKSENEEKSKIKPVKDRTVLVIFFGLLIDLLGM